MAGTAHKVEVTKGNTTYVKPKDLKKGASISGTYQGSFEDKYEKLNHRISQADGSTVVINGTGQLNMLISKVDIGTAIEVVYDGTSTIQSGQFKGTKAHTFKLYKLDGASASGAVGKNEFPF